MEHNRTLVAQAMHKADILEMSEPSVGWDQKAFLIPVRIRSIAACYIGCCNLCTGAGTVYYGKQEHYRELLEMFLQTSKLPPVEVYTVPVKS
jgi:hypothetical protein